MLAHRCPMLLVCAFAALGLSVDAQAQGTSGPTTSDSRVGYIDNAIPGTLFRLRYDDAFNDRRPTRAEFFYPKGAPQGPGLPEPESRVDFQDISAYLEYAPTERIAAFVELPVRFLNPEINAILIDPRTKARFANLNATVLVRSPTEFGKLIADETERWGKVVRAAHIRAE